MSSLKEKFFRERGDFKNIFGRIRKRDFSGDAGLVLKNSIYQLATNFATKGGALLFTIIMARILLPELFGVYSLAISTILIFAAFSDLGINETIIRFVSRELGRANFTKANSYLRYLIKIKSIVTFLVAITLLVSAKLIAVNYYNKPIYLALLAGSIYILFSGIMALLQSIFQSNNLFKPIFYREVIFQSVRIALIPLLIILLLKYSFNNEIIVFWVIMGLAFTYLISGLSLLIYKKIDFHSLIHQKIGLSNLEKKQTNKFILFMSATVLSGVFFGYINIIMLGKFVSSEYIGFYNVAFTFISSLISLITFSTALLPTFTSLNKKRLEIFFKKSLKFSLLLSGLIMILILLFAPILVKIIFGAEYLPSANLLRFFLFLLIFVPVAAVYTVYFTAVGKPAIITKFLIISTLMNIVLNFVFISYLINFGEIYAIYGVTAATIISRGFYMVALILSKKKLEK